MDEDPPIDGLEKKIRLGCGAIAGAVLMPLLAAVSFEIVGKQLWAVAAAGAAAFAFLAIRYGDRFWHGLLEWLKWF